MRTGFDPRNAAIEELMKHLDQSDDEELGSAMKPQEADVAVLEVGATPSGDGTESPGVPGDEPKLSDEEIAELIEALQAKLGG